jgi:hypothetical protein
VLEFVSGGCYAISIESKRKDIQMSLVITKENFDEVRTNGIGNGFSVINPADGFRKDNRLWFGTCSVCNESVTNSAVSGRGWEHTVFLMKGYFSKDNYLKGITNHASSKHVTYCPTQKGESIPCEIYYLENGEKVIVE